jgi:hypothetical protein
MSILVASDPVPEPEPAPIPNVQIRIRPKMPGSGYRTLKLTLKQMTASAILGQK